MRQHGKNRILLGVRIHLLILLPLACGCLVDKGRHDQALDEIASCRDRLEAVRALNESLAQRITAVQEHSASLELENRTLSEAVADLSAEYEELARTTATYRKRGEERVRNSEQEADAYHTLLARLSPEIDRGNIRIDRAGTRLKLNLVDKVLFPSGSADLTEPGKRILDRVGHALKETRDRRILIEGHTDDQPLGPELRRRFASNWDLSARRATAVVHHLEEKVGIDPRLLSATGYSKYAPIVENDSPENRSLNRRIDIVLVPLTPQEMQRIYAVSQEAPPSVPGPGSDPPPQPPAVVPILP